MDDKIRSNKLVGSTVTALSIPGLVHFKSDKYAWLSYIKSYLVITFYTIFNFTQLSFIVVNLDNPQIIVVNFGTIALVLQLVVKCINCVMYRKEYYAIYKTIHEDISDLENQGISEITDILEQTQTAFFKVDWILKVSVWSTIAMYECYYIAAFYIFYK